MLRRTEAAAAIATVLIVFGVAHVSAQAPAPSPQPPSSPASTPAAETLAITVEPSGETSEIVYFNRPIVSLRARVMGRNPDERRVLAVRALDELVAAGQTGPVELRTAPGGWLIGVGRHVIVGLTQADIDPLAGETLDEVATLTKSRVEQVLTEVVDARRPAVWLRGVIQALVALLAAGGLLWGIGRIRKAATARLAALAEKAVAKSGLGDQYSTRASGALNVVQRRLVTVVAVGLQLATFYALLTFVLRRFPYSRPWGDTLRQSLVTTLENIGLGILHAVPSLFTVLVIAVIARAVALLLEPWFAAVERGAIEVPWMHPETAPTTRRLVNIAVWLFAGAMAYPYIPGSNTDAFKGVSLAVGLMVTLGSSGLVNQVMSGLVVTYARALRLGDFVRVGDVEGTIVHLGLLSTKLRTIRSEEMTIPNAVVVSHMTTDYSRFPDAVLTPVSISVGYNVPWRQVCAMLQQAADRTPGIRKTPAPCALQSALDEVRVNYTLVVCLEEQQRRGPTLSALHANMLDLFNEHGVQIVTPNYEADPEEPKLVRKSDWYAAPAPHDTKPGE